MKILLTGATGYIGHHLLLHLLQEGHTVGCCVRDPSRFTVPAGYEAQTAVIKVDFTDIKSVPVLTDQYDVAYYLIHSMSASTKDFDSMEETAAGNFRHLLENSGIQQVIYLSGISNDDSLSKHLSSRLRVEQELRKLSIPVTVLRAGIIVGAGSASFEMIRDLVEKLPVMVAPKWLQTRCQPIYIDNVLDFLSAVKLNPAFYGESYDIGGPDVLTYKEMLNIFAEVRGLKRWIISIPFLTPRLSSYWLYFVTSVSYHLAVNLVDSMKVEVICRPNSLREQTGVQLLGYKDALKRAFNIEGDGKTTASWKDALSSSYQGEKIESFREVPTFGCLQDLRVMEIGQNREVVLDNIWSIGGKRGWYYGTWLWRIRGFLDRLMGGTGLRRGRTHEHDLAPGDALDFWRVLAAQKQNGYLLLFAEMKVPGEAWLEFRVSNVNGKQKLSQKATFMPKGLRGRLYWYALTPFHYFIFRGMLRNIIRYRTT